MASQSSELGVEELKAIREKIKAKKKIVYYRMVKTIEAIDLIRRTNTTVSSLQYIHAVLEDDTREFMTHVTAIHDYDVRIAAATAVPVAPPPSPVREPEPEPTPEPTTQTVELPILGPGGVHLGMSAVSIPAMTAESIRITSQVESEARYKRASERLIKDFFDDIARSQAIGSTSTRFVINYSDHHGKRELIDSMVNHAKEVLQCECRIAMENAPYSPRMYIYVSWEKPIPVPDPVPVPVSEPEPEPEPAAVEEDKGKQKVEHESAWSMIRNSNVLSGLPLIAKARLVEELTNRGRDITPVEILELAKQLMEESCIDTVPSTDFKSLYPPIIAEAIIEATTGTVGSSSSAPGSSDVPVASAPVDPVPLPDAPMEEPTAEPAEEPEQPKSESESESEKPAVVDVKRCMGLVMQALGADEYHIVHQAYNAGHPDRTFKLKGTVKYSEFDYAEAMIGMRGLRQHLADEWEIRTVDSGVRGIDSDTYSVYMEIVHRD